MPTLAIITAMLLWASSYIALKWVFTLLDPMIVLFARMMIATVCVTLVLWWRAARRTSVRFTYQRGDWKWLFIMGMLEPCLYFLFEAQALLYTSASQAAMITPALPLLAAVGAHFFLKERLRSHILIGLVISSIGILCLTLFSHPDAHAPRPWLGNFLEFCAMLCSALFVLIIKRLSPRYSPWIMTGLPAAMGCVWFGAGLFLPSVQWPQSFSPTAWLLVFYLGSAVTLGAYGLNIWAVSRVPIVMATSFNNLIPVFTILIAWLILNETLTPAQWLACGLVLSGVLVSQRRS